MWTVTAESKGKADVDVLDSSAAEVHTIEVTVASSPTSIIISDTAKVSIDITGYLPEDATASDHYMESDDLRYVDVQRKGSSDINWEIIPVSFGMANVNVKKVATGETISTIKVEVKNRAPIIKSDALEPLPEDLNAADTVPAADRLRTLNSDGTSLKLHSCNPYGG